MAKKKHRRKRRNLGLKLGIGFVALFVLSAMVWVGMDFFEAWKAYEEAAALQEAMLDSSWIDSDFSLSWTVYQYISEKDEEGSWTGVEYNYLLRTHNFTDGTVTDISLDENSAFVIPSDDERGFVLVGRNWENEAWIISRLDNAGKVVPMFYEVNPGINRLLGWYDGKLYGEEDVSEPGFFADLEYRLVCWDMETKTKTRYRGSALCLEPDGRAVIMEHRSTGIMEEAGGHTGENGEWIVDYREVKGWTLGIEDLQGNWTPIATLGADSEFLEVPYAAWLDDDRLLLVACSDPEDEEENILYLYTVSTGELVPWKTQDGETLSLHLELSGWFREGTMSVSPDGRFIAYRTAEPDFKDATEIVMVQSLETGRFCKLCPHDPVVTEEQKISTEPYDYRAMQAWHK